MAEANEASAVTSVLSAGHSSLFIRQRVGHFQSNFRVEEFKHDVASLLKGKLP